MKRPRRKSILCVIGTRPEAIKMAPVIKAIERAAWADCRVLVTGQHRELLDPMLEFFSIRPDGNLHVMRSGQSLSELQARLLLGLNEAFASHRPDLVLAQGDTTTVLATALASFSHQIPFGHVEAGLRTHDLGSPFPEEANRVLASQVARLHFAPTHGARDNLLREGIAADAIEVVGNTVIDALLWAVEREEPIGVELDQQRRLVLVTAHRRENFGAGLMNICRAVLDLVRRHDDIEVLWPVHPNPAVGPVVSRHLDHQPRIHLCSPLGYGSFASAMRRAFMIITDSGGIQEEAPALGKPVLVMRELSERPEALAAGVARLVGTDRDQIVHTASELLDHADCYEAMIQGGSPYGDGRAAQRIETVLARYLGVPRSCGMDAPPDALSNVLPQMAV